MKVDVTQLEDRQDVRHHYTDFDPQDADLGVLEQPEVHLSLRRRSDGIHAAGKVTTIVEVRCDRCLLGLPVAVAADFDLLYLPLSLAAAEKGEHEIVEEQEFHLAYYEDESIDVDALVREQIQLALPIRNLCDEACKGLCPVCGADLNKAPCLCHPESRDPRWDALAEWQQKHKAE